MHRYILKLCTAVIAASHIATPALAVEAVRTEAAQQLVEKQPPAGNVSTKVFTAAIVDGKPADNRKTFENTVNTVYFYTVLEQLKGHNVTHRWRYNGRVISNADINVTDDPFPAWSSNKMEPDWTGFWTVEVVDKNNKVISFGTFEYNHPRNLQMDPDANKAGTDSEDVPFGGWGHGQGWSW